MELVSVHADTVQLLYNTPHYNMDLGITQSSGSQLQFYKGIMEK